MMLCEQIYGEVMFEHLYVGMLLDTRHELVLYLAASIIFVMQYAVLAVTSLSGQIVTAALFVESHTPAYQVFDTRRSALHHYAHGFGIALVGAAYHSVAYMLVEIVGRIGDRRYAALRLGRIGSGYVALGHHYYTSVPGNLQCHAQAGGARTYDKEITLSVHGCLNTIQSEIAIIRIIIECGSALPN